MKHLFLVNPAAGKRDATAMYQEAVAAGCKDVDYEIRVSQKPGDITAWTKEAASTGAELHIYACGGDGTLNEVVNGAAGFQNVAVTHFPGGSGNDFIKIFSDAKPFFDLVPLMNNPEETEFDLICCNSIYGLNTCSIGLDARIAAGVAKYKRLPLVSGSGAYLLSTAVHVFKKISEDYENEIDGKPYAGKKTLVCVANGCWYGGGFHPVPDADPADGKLEVLLVEPTNLLQIAKVVGKYKAGLYQKLPLLITHRTCKNLVLRSAQPVAAQLDGELLTRREMRIGIAPWKLRFFYPRGLTWQQKERIPAKTGGMA